MDKFLGVPLEHTLIAAMMFAALLIVTRDIALAAAVPSAFFISREFRDWQKGSGFGWYAFLAPCAACLCLYVFGSAL